MREASSSDEEELDEREMAREAKVLMEEGSDDGEHAMKALIKLASLYQDPEWKLDDLHKLLPDDLCTPDSSNDDREARLTAIKAGLNEIFDSAWFQRTWTVQDPMDQRLASHLGKTT